MNAIGTANAVGVSVDCVARQSEVSTAVDTLAALLSFDELEATLARILGAVPAAARAGVMAIANGTVIGSIAWTDDHVVGFEKLQRRYRQGPGVQAAQIGQAQHVEDLQRETRWPDLVPQAISHTRIRSVLAFPLFVGGGLSGVLSLYADPPHAFTNDSRDLATFLAARSRHAVVDARRAAPGLAMAIGRGDVIGAAKTALMRRFALDDRAALSLLMKLTQQNSPGCQPTRAQTEKDSIG